MRPITLIPFYLAVAILLTGCDSATDGHQAGSLRLLTAEEIVQRAREKRAPSPYVVFKDSLGNPLDATGREKLNAGVWAPDQYVNETGEVVEMIARKATFADEILAVLVDEAYRSGRPTISVPVECENQRTVLEELLAKDLDVERTILRTDLNRSYDSDRENQYVLANLIEQCGFPTREKVGDKGMEAVCRVFLHATSQFIAAHYLTLQERTATGDLPRAYLAEITDYLLALHGREQMYGTQIRFNPSTGQNELYPLRQPKTVDQRRSAVGLEPIAVFLEEMQAAADF